jgi:sulfite reductase (ferredoxin)
MAKTEPTESKLSKPEPSTPQLSKVETLKSESGYLRGSLPEQLASDSTHVDEAGYQLLKFSGMYQQDDRDQRKERRKEGKERAYSFMVRSKLPGGAMSAEQYLVHDLLAGKYGNGTLRFTTRQGIQLHGVLKGNLRSALRELSGRLVTTLAACGDVVRNVMACPAPERTREQALVQRVAREIEEHFLPRSQTYYDLWLDGRRLELGRKVYGRPVDSVEPIYGKTYLPRKFKIGIAFPHDNCVDVFTQDIGIVPVLEGERLHGYDLLVGGGMGMSHTDGQTFARLAEPLGLVPPDGLLEALEVIVGIQRDHGDRTNRRRARMKYLVHDWGIDAFRTEFERRYGRPLGEWVETGPFQADDHLGWRPQGGGRWYYGIPVENGRIADRGDVRLRTGLREIARRFGSELRITARHDLLVTGLEEAQQGELLALLGEHGIRTPAQISQARRQAMACPALPTCGLALAESERALPGIIDEIERELAVLGLAGEAISIRMTGCPNGCARPYTAEIAFVGRSLDLYNVYVGGSEGGRHLVQEYAASVRGHELVATVRPLLAHWQRARRRDEAFGDFCRRVGVQDLRAQAAAAVVAGVA